TGFHYGNPFYSNRGPQRETGQSFEPQTSAGTGKPAAGTGGRARLSRFKVSLRARNFNSEKLKVNDKRGNPIEIDAVVVWRVGETAQAMLDVDDFENYVR